MPRTEAVPVPTIRCDDDEVRAFVDAEMRNFSPYAPRPTAHELHAIAKKRFGLARCLTLEWWEQ